MAEQLERETTVLFAHVLGGADLTAGPFRSCMEKLRATAKASGARVLEAGTARIMVVLATPDAAADAAAAMHTAMEGIPQYGEEKITLGIGFHHGPAIPYQDQGYGESWDLVSLIVA